MRNHRILLYWFLAFGTSIVSINAQSENAPKPLGRHIISAQINALEKALADQPKGTILIESLGFFPPPPLAYSPPPQLPTPESPSLKPLVADWNQQQKSPGVADSEFEETKAITEQLWNVLQKCGYDPMYPGPSHGLPPNGISIRVVHHIARPMADALLKSLIVSGIQNVQIKEDPKEEAYYLKYLPSYKPLVKITIGSE